MISVIVPARNEAATIGACLDALMGQEGLGAAMEVIVVDDGSSDGTDVVAAGHVDGSPHSLRVLAGPARGVSAARNAGAAAADGDLLLFTDADCRPVRGWAAALEAALRDPTIAGATGRQATTQSSVIARLVQAEVDEKQATLVASRRLTFADTASAAYRAHVFRAAGGFDEGLRNFEDTELAFRLAEAGHRLVVVDGAVVHHEHAESLRAYARRKARIGYWGAAVYRAHPGRVIDDSRTPRSMRLQLGLAPAILVAGALSPVHHAARATAFLGCGAFLLSTLPYLRFAWRRAGPAAALGPLLAFVRAMALGAGLAAGLARLALGSHPALGTDR